MSSLTVDNINQFLDRLYTALASDELEVEDSDGNRIKYKSSNDVNRAIDRLEQLKKKKLGQTNKAFVITGGKSL